MFERIANESWSDAYSNSKENSLRSLNVYHSHDVMGKRKYSNVRKANNRFELNNKINKKNINKIK